MIRISTTLRLKSVLMNEHTFLLRSASVRTVAKANIAQCPSLSEFGNQTELPSRSREFLKISLLHIRAAGVLKTLLHHLQRSCCGRG